MKKDLRMMQDLTRQDIMDILDVADQMKYDLQHGIPHRFLEGKTVVMLFERNSTRTRVSFEAGIYQLGGHGIYLTGPESQVVRSEQVEDTARSLSRYSDALVLRTYAQEEVDIMAKCASIPVINGLTNYAHPCQVLADLMTIRENLSTLEGLKVGYVGDGSNICNSLIVGMLTCGIDITVACPKGYEPHRTVLDFAKTVSDAKLTLTHTPAEAAKDADVLLTDVWVSVGKEAEQAARVKDFQGFQLNDDLLAYAKPGCMVLHNLPANRGQEITAEVLEAHADEIFQSTENRLHVQKAVLYLLTGGIPGNL